MRAKKKYTLRFFKEQHNGDSYERQVEELTVFHCFCTCRRYFLTPLGKSRKGNRFYNLTMVFDKQTFIVLLKVEYPILIRLMGKYFDKNAIKTNQL